ncbi:hypothetical protein Tco_0460829 [Tanacetum coccineum]
MSIVGIRFPKDVNNDSGVAFSSGFARGGCRGVESDLADAFEEARLVMILVIVGYVTTGDNEGCVLPVIAP